MAGGILFHIQYLRSLRSTPFFSVREPSVFSSRTAWLGFFQTIDKGCCSPFQGFATTSFSFCRKNTSRSRSLIASNNSRTIPAKCPGDQCEPKSTPFFLKVRGGFGGRAKTSFSEKRSFRSPPDTNQPLTICYSSAEEVSAVPVSSFISFSRRSI